ncbi:hypothetical protein [Sandaracinus amylolyticus]|nr:hypothetical protein [Sandaracinus amylolyticus]
MERLRRVACVIAIGALMGACGSGTSQSPTERGPSAHSTEPLVTPDDDAPAPVAQPEPIAQPEPATTPEPEPVAQPEPTPVQTTTPPSRDRFAFFVSGHSLTDDPLADRIVDIARGLGVSAQYNEQIGIGSPIRLRTRGMDDRPGLWAGYRTGKNRGGTEGLDVIAELRAPRTIEGRYDALIITERHDLVDVLMWENTVRHLRHFHDRLTAGNPQATTYLYESWLGVRDLADPRDWIAYERAAQPVWDCVADRVELSLRDERRPSHVRSIPTNAALALLVERAVAGRVDGLRGANARAITQRIFHDDVHMTPLGVYFVALVTSAVVLERSPVGAPVPPGIEPALAASLQSIAWEAARAHAARTPRTPAQCRALMRDSFCAQYGAYTRRTDGVENCRRTFADGNAEGPFHHDPASDASRWFAAP